MLHDVSSHCKNHLFVGGRCSSHIPLLCLHVGRVIRNVDGDSIGKCHFLQQHINNVDGSCTGTNLLGFAFSICVTAGTNTICCDNAGNIDWKL